MLLGSDICRYQALSYAQASVLIGTYIIPISIVDINHYLMNCVTVF